MLIGVKKRFVFIANSKTASTSIEAMLTPFAEINRIGSPKRKHISWQQCREEYGFVFDNPLYAPETFFRFGVIREPAEWIRSWYNYRFTQGASVAARFKNERSFEEFWASDDWVKRKSQQSKFIDADGISRFDLIIPLERLSEALPLVQGTLDIPASPLPRENKSKFSLSRKDIHHELIAEINDYYAADYALWETSKACLHRLLTSPGGLSIPKSQTRQDQNTPHFETIACTLVEHARFTVEPSDKAGSSQHLLKGSVLLKESAHNSKWELMIRDGHGARKMEWPLPSVALAKRLSQHPNADRARFKAVEIDMSGATDAEVFLVDDAGSRHVIGRIKPRQS